MHVVLLLVAGSVVVESVRPVKVVSGSLEAKRERSHWYHILTSAAQARHPASSACYFGDFYMEIFGCLLTFL